jgi:hypothetical protein
LIDGEEFLMAPGSPDGYAGLERPDLGRGYGRG